MAEAGDNGGAGRAAGQAQQAAEERPGGMGLFQLLAQAALMYYLWTNVWGGKSKTPSSAVPDNSVPDFQPPKPTTLPKPAAQPMSFMGVKMGMDIHPELEDFHQMRRLELSQIPRNTVLKNAWGPSESFDLHAWVCTHADPDRLTKPLAAAAEAEAPPADMATSSVTTLEFQGSGSFIVKAISGVTSLVKRITGAGDEESAAAASPSLGNAAAPGGSPASAVLLEGLSSEQAAEHAGCVQVWHQTGMTYDHEPVNFRSRHVNVSLPQRVAAHNGTAFLHVWVSASGHSPSPIAPSFTRSGAVHVVHPLVKHMPKRKQKELKSLMGGGDEGAEGGAADPEATPHPDARDLLSDPFGWNKPAAPEADEEDPKHVQGGDDLDDDEFAGTDADAAADAEAEADEGAEETPILAYWKPAAAISIIPDWSAQKVGAIAPFVIDVLQADPDASPPAYLPHLYVNDFWQLQNDLVELNGTLSVVPLHLTFTPMSLWKFSLQAQMTASWSAQSSWGMTGGDGAAAGAENDMLKKMMLDTNPILLAITLTVSLLHTLFDFLAFKNDISFWRNAKTMEGLSLRTVGMNVFFQVVILLYLWDNDTSWMILGSSVMGLGIEVWKLKKAMSVGISWPAGGHLPVVQWETKDDAYVRSKTKMYDDMAMSHLSVLLYPLVLGYAVYSLLYDKHKSWFSWVITSLTGFVYAFGFILMTPQLFINYKLKSVAALPWRALTYKFLNTIVDDLFAFVIDMPIMHRLSVFRDDIVFLVYLYQRWAYRVDLSRANEFGASGEDYEAAKLRAEGKLRTAKRSKWELADGSRGKTAPAAPPALVDASEQQDTAGEGEGSAQ